MSNNVHRGKSCRLQPVKPVLCDGGQGNAAVPEQNVPFFKGGVDNHGVFLSDELLTTCSFNSPTFITAAETKDSITRDNSRN